MMFAKPDPELEDKQITPASHVPASSGTTLLPRPIASLVSLLTQSTSLSLRVGTFFGGVVLDGARTTTLTSLELGRAVIEGILTRAGRDVAFRSGDAHGRAEAESLLERSVGFVALLNVLALIMTCMLTSNLVGYITYNGDLCIILCCGHVSFFIDDAGIGCQFLAGSFVDFGRNPRVYRIVKGHCRYHYPHSTRVQVCGSG